jgi:Protein of unknown function (DUF1501)
LNQALTAFTDEIKAQGLWNKVTIVLTSEISRTLTANSGKGSDHAWGGNYFVMGGAVKGGKIYRSYPSDITPAGPVNIGRGSLIPTLSWESMMNAMVQWMGVETEADLDDCMPNRKRAGTPLYYSTDVFDADSSLAINVVGEPPLTSSPSHPRNSASPSFQSSTPSLYPSVSPTNSLSKLIPSSNPSLEFSSIPTGLPSIVDTSLLSEIPSFLPSLFPNHHLNENATVPPTSSTTVKESGNPSVVPTISPSDSPSDFSITLKPSLKPFEDSYAIPKSNSTFLPSLSPSQTNSSELNNTLSNVEGLFGA